MERQGINLKEIARTEAQRFVERMYLRMGNRSNESTSAKTLIVHANSNYVRATISYSHGCAGRILCFFTVGLELVCRHWRELCLMAARNEEKPVWIQLEFGEFVCTIKITRKSCKIFHFKYWNNYARSCK
uniref:SWIM-type domain-containing protein n=1 Tax=Parascaris equorum TaxID=6256 RepID=A0A914S4W4_PAREQ